MCLIKKKLYRKARKLFITVLYNGLYIIAMNDTNWVKSHCKNNPFLIIYVY